MESKFLKWAYDNNQPFEVTVNGDRDDLQRVIDLTLQQVCERKALKI